MAIADSDRQGTTSVAKRLFIGQFGIRAGWSLILFGALLFCVNYGISTVVLAASNYIKHQGAKPAGEAESPASKDSSAEFRPAGLIRGEAVGFLSVALATLFIARIERRPASIYGLGKAQASNVLPGLLTGFVALSALVALLRQSHLLMFSSRNLYGSSLFQFALLWAIAFFLVGIGEEYLLRGYFLFTLERGVFGLGFKLSPLNVSTVSFWMAAFLSSLAFAALHLANPGENVVGILGVFAMGLLRCYALWRTGSLWWSIGMHAAWDWSQSFLWGVPDSGQLCVGRLFNTHSVDNPLLSGGSAGPEGSLFMLPAILLVAVVIRATTRGRGTLARLRDDGHSLESYETP